MTLQPLALIPPDAELWGTAYLRPALASRPEPYAQGVYVSNTKPTTNRPRTVVVRRDGGLQRGAFDFPRLAVRVWADVEKDAADLSRLVQALLLGAAGDGTCVAVTSLSGPSAIAEPGQFQKFLTIELQMRCSPL